MDENKVKKRGWVKNAAIIFLSIMLVLTFFSNTIMNRSLPEVSVANVESGTINAKIRGSGTVTAGESYEVVLKQTRKVESVHVKVGDYVETGDVMFLLSDAESQELKEAMDRLDDMRLSYQKNLLNMDDPDYAQDNRAIQKAREALNKAIADRDASVVPEYMLTEAQLALRGAEANKRELEAELAKASEQLSAAEAELQSTEGAIAGLEKQIDDLKETISDTKRDIRELQSGIGDVSEKLAEARQELSRAKSEFSSAQLSYTKADPLQTMKAAYDSLREKADKFLGGGASEDDLFYQMQAMINNAGNESAAEDEKATEAEAEAFEELTKLSDAVSKAEKEVAKYEGLVQNQTSVQEQIAQAEDALRKAERGLDDASADRSALQRRLRSLERDAKDAAADRESLEEDVFAAGEETKRLQDAYDELKDKQSNYDTAVQNVESCQDTVDDLVFALAEKKKADGKIEAGQQLDLTAARKEITEQEELVAELQQNAVGQEVTADISGLVSNVSAVAGREANAGEALATIEVVDRGYSLRFPVTNEQSKRVRIGDTAEVSNYYWGEEVNATLTQIANDPANPGKGKMLVFTVVGDVSSGQNLTLSIGEKSANFDSLIPNSAIRTDTNGTFVLVVTAKSSPLGNRYSATRVDVSVLAQDDTTSAVSGLTYGDYVITNSSKPLEAGMLVKMVENP